MNRAFVEPYAKFVLNINFFRKVVLVELRVNEVSQCRRSHQRVGHDLVKREEHLDSKRSWPRYLGQADSANDPIFHYLLLSLFPRFPIPSEQPGSGRNCYNFMSVFYF